MIPKVCKNAGSFTDWTDNNCRTYRKYGMVPPYCLIEDTMVKVAFFSEDMDGGMFGRMGGNSGICKERKMT